jgi:hypothetical protein
MISFLDRTDSDIYIYIQLHRSPALEEENCLPDADTYARYLSNKFIVFIISVKTRRITTRKGKRTERKKTSRLRYEAMEYCILFVELALLLNFITEQKRILLYTL